MPKRLGCMNGWVVTYNGKIKAMYNINMKIKVKIYTRLQGITETDILV